MMTAQQFYLWQSCGLFLCAGLGWLVLAQTDFAESRLGKLVIRLAGATWVAYAGLVFLEVVWTCDGTPWWIYYTTGCWLN